MMNLPASSLQNQGITFNSKATSVKAKKKGKETRNGVPHTNKELTNKDLICSNAYTTKNPMITSNIVLLKGQDFEMANPGFGYRPEISGYVPEISG
jgi:hypothetical protein